MKLSTMLLVGITGVGVLTSGSYPVNAQSTVDLPQLVLTAKHRETVTVPDANSTTQLVAVRSSNPGVATAQLFRNNQIEIIAVAPGKTTVEFFDRARGRAFRQPVWVHANATGGGGAGYDPGKTQLKQIVMRIKHTENVTVPGPGPHQLSSVVSSNPSVATARTNTANTIQVYANALGDTWIDFRDNATGTTYQVHVWVTNTGALPPAGPVPGTTQPQPSNATAPEIDLFNNFNTGGVVNGPRSATRFTLDRPATISTLVTYHWNNGRGAVPGAISLRDQNGKIYGPFTAIGSSGQGGAANVDWTARANVTVPAGTYAVLDSNPATWSHNAQSGFAGFAKVQGRRTQGGGSMTANLNSAEIAVNDSVSENLLVNGDAEAGLGSNDGSVVTVPGWQTSGFFTVMRYDGRSDELLSTSPGPSDRGRNFFLGGTDGASSSAAQRISVSRFAPAIDSGRAEFRLSGWLGGWETQNDQTTLTVTFTDARGSRLGTSSIGPVTNTDRQNVASLLERSDSGKVPAGTRWIDVELRMVRAVGTWNDGFADNLSLTIYTRQ